MFTQYKNLKDLFEKTVNKLIDLDSKTSKTIKETSTPLSGMPNYDMPADFDRPRWNTTFKSQQYYSKHQATIEERDRKLEKEYNIVNMMQKLIDSILTPVFGVGAIKPDQDAKEVNYHQSLDYVKCRNLAAKLPAEFTLEQLREINKGIMTTLKYHPISQLAGQEEVSQLLQLCQRQLDSEISRLSPSKSSNQSGMSPNPSGDD